LSIFLGGGGISNRLCIPCFLDFQQ